MEIAHKATGPIVTKEEKALYEALKKLPQPSVNFNMSKDQRKWWFYFGHEFIKTNQVSNVDLIHLQKLAFWMDARCKAYEQIEQLGYNGLVQKFASGATNVTGHVTIIEKADKHIDEVSAHFGLSIRDRQRLKKQETNPDQLSLFEKVAEKLSQAN